MASFAVNPQQDVLHLLLKLTRLSAPPHLQTLLSLVVVLSQNDPHALPRLLGQHLTPLGCQAIQHMLQGCLEVRVCHQRL